MSQVEVEAEAELAVAKVAIDASLAGACLP